VRYAIREYINPFVLARNLFKPASANSSTVLSRLSMWRSRIGCALILYLSFPYTGLNDTISGIFADASLNILIGSVATIVAIVLLRIANAGPASATLRKSSREPLKKAVISIALTVGFGLIERSSVLDILGFFAIPLLLWTIIFLAAMVWYLARYLFGAQEAHPILGPIVLGITVVLATAVKLANLDAGVLPRDLEILITLSGLATTLALAAVEFGALRRSGVRLTLAAITPSTVLPYRAQISGWQPDPRNWLVRNGRRSIRTNQDPTRFIRPDLEDFDPEYVWSENDYYYWQWRSDFPYRPADLLPTRAGEYEAGYPYTYFQWFFGDSHLIPAYHRQVKSAWDDRCLYCNGTGYWMNDDHNRSARSDPWVQRLVEDPCTICGQTGSLTYARRLELSRRARWT